MHHSPSQRLSARTNSAPRHTAGHPRVSVSLGFEHNKTRLCTPIRSKGPVFQRCGPNLCGKQGCACPAFRGKCHAGERGHRSGPYSTELVGVLQQVLPRPQKRWRPPAHPRSQTAEQGPNKVLIQNDHFEADLPTNTPGRLVLYPGSERCLFSHPDSPPPQTRAVGSPCVVSQQEPASLPENVLNTISQARAPSTRCLYSLKWAVFAVWCTARGEDPLTCDISQILSFLQDLMDRGRTASTLKVYVAAIAASHVPIAGQSIGRNNLVVRFLKGSRRLNLPRPLTVPTWDLSVVLRGLKDPPFEPIQTADRWLLSLKTALLLALALVKRVGDLQALSVSPSCLEFGPNDSKVVLKPRHGYVPKVLSTPFRAQMVVLSALPPSQDEQELNLLCPVRALRSYIDRSASFRQAEQLFVCFGGHSKGLLVSKPRLSRWTVNAIALTYSSLGLQCPLGVRAHSTRGMASSWAWSCGVSIADICAAAGWASPSTFVRFYNLEVPALQSQVLSA
ncbi:uncharacterized protein LOC127516273 [Ctenopharyngodon idella]|uniref:uncharacterized protein LOC127516273 n=1 Tax=Ctenopharyngodon idella TaxID=7959 RepID=UPI002230516E|nr:uncharacterized protein LOC127516273 [Ctenopharyngodon idella]